MLLELVDTPIRVTQINPGMVNTEFSTIRFGGDSAKADAVYKGLQPLCGQDVGKLESQMLSRRNGYLHKLTHYLVVLAEVITFAASRPPHVTIADVLGMCSTTLSCSC
jgi:3-hydroxy acid dehydrogenase/malonic semialdehyde reductase